MVDWAFSTKSSYVIPIKKSAKPSQSLLDDAASTDSVYLLHLCQSDHTSPDILTSAFDCTYISILSKQSHPSKMFSKTVCWDKNVADNILTPYICIRRRKRFRDE